MKTSKKNIERLKFEYYYDMAMHCRRKYINNKSGREYYHKKYEYYYNKTMETFYKMYRDTEWTYVKI